MLVTDAMPTVGWAGDSFRLLGREVRRADGRLTTAGGTLAGSDLDMAQAVANMVRWTGASVEDAVKMASSTPAACMASSTSSSAALSKAIVLRVLS